jgi:hypothetical protein
MRQVYSDIGFPTCGLIRALLPFLLLMLLSRIASGDVALDVVCLLDESVFPSAQYDAVVERVSNSTLAARTIIRSDLITGAEAKVRYFRGNHTIRRFELLHVTRARSVIQQGDVPASVVAGLLSMKLSRAVAGEGLGVCGIDQVLDLSAPPPSASDSQWFLGMPALVAPIALAGWVFTVVSCLICWFCVCCTAPENATASAVVVPPEVPAAGGVGDGKPVSGIPIGTPPPSKAPPAPSDPVAVSVDKADTSSSRKKTRQKAARSTAAAQIPNPSSNLLPYRISESSLRSHCPSQSIDFHHSHQALRFMDLRIPSFQQECT